MGNDGCTRSERSYGGLFSEAEFGNLQNIYLNKSSLTAMIEAAASSGVQCIEVEAINLMFDHGGSCVGVRTTDGQVFFGEKIVLASGAEAAKLLVASAPDLPQLHIGCRLSRSYDGGPEPRSGRCNP